MSSSQESTFAAAHAKPELIGGLLRDIHPIPEAGYKNQFKYDGAARTSLTTQRAEAQDNFKDELFSQLPQFIAARDRVGCFARKNSKIATYRDGQGCFYHEVKMTSREVFSLTPAVLDSGPFAGCKALILMPTSRFHVEKLPAELRQIIYKMCFQVDHRIELYRYGSGISARGLSNLKLAAILLTNRTTYYEALPLLYEVNKFQFDDFETATRFVMKSRVGRRYVATLTVESAAVKPAHADTFHKSLVACV